MTGFLNFIRTQGIAGLAIGFVIGAAAQDFIKAFSTDILNPVISAAMGQFGDLANASSTVGSITFGWGHFLSALINLLLIALVIYFAVKLLRIERLDETKNTDIK